tara:strand:+ start:421 stop:849 length:429 start_codon:yes stop_codon:yes gene_type:complete
VDSVKNIQKNNILNYNRYSVMLDIKEICYYLVAIIHTLCWIFVLLAFINKKTAHFNLYYFIPLIYILHTILPVHPLNFLKDCLKPETKDSNGKRTIEPDIIGSLLNSFKGYSFEDPLGTQGKMIFGLITSAYVLKKKCITAS